MRTRLYAGIGSGLVMSMLVVGGLFVALGTAKPAAAVGPDRVEICHLQQKVDPTLQFNDGKVIEVSKEACRAHCAHGDHPMPSATSPSNVLCARIHVIEGLPSCEVNTPNTASCTVAQCIARCDAS